MNEFEEHFEYLILIGDFAMLLKSGMSLKQAFTCNLLSSILCFLGASLGITIGNIDSITSWVFSITAGIFIYIALVDMVRTKFTINQVINYELHLSPFTN